jgi:hypothetical protein
MPNRTSPITPAGAPRIRTGKRSRAARQTTLERRAIRALKYGSAR